MLSRCPPAPRWEPGPRDGWGRKARGDGDCTETERDPERRGEGGVENTVQIQLLRATWLLASLADSPTVDLTQFRLYKAQ